MRQVARGNAAPVVLHREADARQAGKLALKVDQLACRGVRGDAEDEHATIRHSVRRIEGQVQHDLMKFNSV